MKHQRNNKGSFILLAVLVVISLNGCASVGYDAADGEGQLRQTAERYWSLRMADDYRETYAMEANGAHLPPFDTYLQKVRAMKRLRITGYRITKVLVQGLQGELEVEFNFMVPGLSAPLTTSLRDLWVLQDDQWHHVLP